MIFKRQIIIKARFIIVLLSYIFKGAYTIVNKLKILLLIKSIYIAHIVGTLTYGEKIYAVGIGNFNACIFTCKLRLINIFIKSKSFLSTA